MRNSRQPSFADLELQSQVALDPALEAISELLDRHRELVESVREDLVRGLKRSRTGRRGMTAEQVLRAFVLKSIKNWDLRELRERTADGYSLRLFTRFFCQPVPRHDAFNRAFHRLRPETLLAINEALIRVAVDLGLEDGKRLRVDTSVVETDIHWPTDSTLLWDAVRVITRLVRDFLEKLPAGNPGTRFRNRTRSARRRMQEIQRMSTAQRCTRLVPKYRELLRIAEQVVGQARSVLSAAPAFPMVDLLRAVAREARAQEIEHYCGLAERVIAQTRRRVLEGEQVPAADKIYSIFEPHTDLIKRGKAQKPVEFGRKIFLAESRIGLITQYRVIEGNPNDHGHVAPSLEEHQRLFGGAPELYAGDRGFYSPANLEACREAGVGVECLPQCGGWKTPERAAYEKSTPFRKGQRFRAGIEGRISVLFRGRGLKRCLLAGPVRFEVFVGLAVLANNLLIIAERLVRRRRRRHTRAA
jgi:IS5 family transposase